MSTLQGVPLGKSMVMMRCHPSKAPGASATGSRQSPGVAVGPPPQWRLLRVRKARALELCMTVEALDWRIRLGASLAAVARSWDARARGAL